MLQATQIRAGTKILFNGKPHLVISVQHITPGNWRGMVQAKLKNLETGSNVEYRFRSDEKVEKAIFEKHEMEYLYSSDAQHYFMNTETYEQTVINDEFLGDTKYYLIANIKFMIEFYEGRVVGVEPPKVVELKVVDTQPNLKGATAASSQKPATLETGLVVNVPPFIETGEVVRIDTEEAKYLERAK